MRYLLLLSFVCAAHAQPFDHAHPSWDALLKKHVVLVDGGKASRLDYAGLAAERGALRGYLDALSRVTQAEFDGWSRAQQMAFLVNAYNAFTAEKILTRYPKLESIWDFGRFFGNPFRDEFFTLVGGRMSLDEVEHGILRKRYRDPRVHYAVNCASIGCQLDEQARRFLSDRTRNRAFTDYDWALNDSRSSSPR